jgi:hypothetical protein
MPDKDSMYDDQQADYDEKLAKFFGITEEELDLLEYEFNEEISDDGLSHLGSYISFRNADDHPEIMKKIIDLESDSNCVRFGPNGPDID